MLPTRLKRPEPPQIPSPSSLLPILPLLPLALPLLPLLPLASCTMPSIPRPHSATLCRIRIVARPDCLTNSRRTIHAYGHQRFDDELLSAC
jgi:hypothetical protein